MVRLCFVALRIADQILPILKHFLHLCCLNPLIHEDFPKIKDLPKEKRI